MSSKKLNEVYKNAFEKYRQYYKHNQWNGEDIAHYLKANWIDFEEYNYEEFVEKCKTDQRFNQKWGNQ